MNDFTVAEARDALLKEHVEFTDEVESRKFIYRQLTRTIEKGLLKRADCFKSGAKKVIYSKTDKFFASTIMPLTRGSEKIATLHKVPKKVFKTVNYKDELQKELYTYELDLNTVIEEAKEYKRLSIRFPELREKLQQHQLHAKEKSIQLLGKVQALQNLLSDPVTEQKGC
tara:strand:+ start:1865 stop:2374 length:510 start_codon:yes stop_codon:yes gene_type:complete